MKWRLLATVSIILFSSCEKTSDVDTKKEEEQTQRGTPIEITIDFLSSLNRPDYIFNWHILSTQKQHFKKDGSLDSKEQQSYNNGECILSFYPSHPNDSYDRIIKQSCLTKIILPDAWDLRWDLNETGTMLLIYYGLKSDTQNLYYTANFKIKGWKLPYGADYTYAVEAHRRDTLTNGRIIEESFNLGGIKLN